MNASRRGGRNKDGCAAVACQWCDRSGNGGQSGGFFFVLSFLNRHIAKFVGVENLAAIEALDKLGVIFTRYYADLGMLTDRIHGVIRAVRVVLGQIVPAQGRLSTGMCRVRPAFAW